MLEIAAASTSGTAWTRSVPTSFTADRPGVEHQQRDHDDRAGADAGDADQQAAEGADQQGRDRPDRAGPRVGVVPRRGPGAG